MTLPCDPQELYSRTEYYTARPTLQALSSWLQSCLWSSGNLMPGPGLRRVLLAVLSTQRSSWGFSLMVETDSFAILRGRATGASSFAHVLICSFDSQHLPRPRPQPDMTAAGSSLSPTSWRQRPGAAPSLWRLPWASSSNRKNRHYFQPHFTDGETEVRSL